ncbi:hypothetical protein D9Q98_001801 [Chlorella vulgaris]|uniref:Uncharacterized protein n=1 Tax=Chlorella vulgaris TaxID=3077 RepID=A0A9D4TV84_CHLVU|nr:hypothetical protein D9Q98_001801 [Chlorella vulgaris]
MVLSLVVSSEAAELPSGGASLSPGQSGKQLTDTLPVGAVHVVQIQPTEGTNPSIRVTLTPMGDETGDADLYCSRGSDGEPGPDNADFQSEAIGVNQDMVMIPPANDLGSPLVYSCSVFNRGLTTVSYKLQVTYESGNSSSLSNTERAVAQQLYDRCCGPDSSCRRWKLASEAAARESGAPASSLDTDLCQFGMCSNGSLVQLNARGWFMECPFPGDLFAQFTHMQYLYLSYNDFTGDLDEAAASLAGLAELQEVGLKDNQRLTGQLTDGGNVCKLVQGTVEMLQLDGTSLSGTLPACLFDGTSTLYQFNAAGSGLTGSIPDAFATSARLQVLDLRNNEITGSIPPSLAAAPNLNILDLAGNSLTGSIPEFASAKLTVLRLAANQLSGAVPDSLAGHPALTVLDLQSNALTSLPDAWQGAAGQDVTAPLNDLRVSSNRLEGSFPAALAAYPNLTALLLDGNQLSGELPDPQTGDYAVLRLLVLATNAFTGGLGPGWQRTGIWQLPPGGRDPTLWNVFDVAANQLSGEVPGYMRNASNQQINIVLAGNQFTSTTGADADAASTGTDGGSGSGGLSTGAVAGICLGIVLASALVLAVGLVLVRRQRRRNTQSEASAVKFSRFEDEELPSARSPAAPPTFYETSHAPHSPGPAAAPRAVEMRGSSSNV